MGFLNNLLSRIKKPSIPKEIYTLSNSCNVMFTRIFNKCRRELGQELIEVMNIKKSAIEKLDSDIEKNIKVLLVKKILLLVETYLKLAENYSSCMEGSRNFSPSESTASELIKANREKLSQVVSLLKSLNVQLNLNSDSCFAEDSDEIINEALALNNVLNDNLKNKL